MTDGAIFGLRFQANEDLQPTQEALQRFLEGPGKDQGSEKFRDGLASYVRDLQAVDDFESNSPRGIAEFDFNEQKLLGVFAHSHFFKSALKLAVEHYLFHCSKLCALDFKKPRSFIKAAQEEINSLSPRKTLDKPKIVRLQAMVDQRTEALEALEKERLALTKELKNIALYVRENLVRIEKLCESSISLLVNLQLGKEKEHELIEDLKKQFKDEIRDHMQLGPVSREYAEKLKDDFSALSKQLSQVVLEDIYSVTLVYEQIHDHADKFATGLDALIRHVEEKKGERFEEHRDALGKIQQELIALISAYRFSIKKTEEIVHKDDHERLLGDKRKEMLSHLFNLLRSGAEGTH